MNKSLTIVFVIICLLFVGCTQKFESRNKAGGSEVKQNNNKQNNPIEGDNAPFSIDGLDIQPDGDNYEFSIQGFDYQLDGDNLVASNGMAIRLYKLPDKKPVKVIPVEKRISGFDISGDIITWSSPNETSNSEIFIYYIETSQQKQITDLPSGQYGPKIWKNYIIWQDDRNDPSKNYPGRWSLYLYDLNTGKEKLLTDTLAPHATYNICDYKVVWEDERNMTGDDIHRGGDNVPENNKDIYLYDMKTEEEIAIATGPLMECKPDVYGDYVVWEDRNNGSLAADIVLYNLTSKETKHITKDKFGQDTPKIYRNYVVWVDERNGTSTNDVIIAGQPPNSDIFIYDIEKGAERNLTGKGPQILPSISSKWVVFILSSQVNPLIQAMEYKE